MLVITPLNTVKKCFNRLENIYEKKDPTQNRDLKNKLWNMVMERYETTTSFVTNISHVKDQLAIICVETDEDDLLQIAIDGITSSWDIFLVAANGREEHPKFKILWHDCIQEEGCIRNKVMITKEDNLSLTLTTKKGRNPFAPKKLFRA